MVKIIFVHHTGANNNESKKKVKSVKGFVDYYIQ